MPIPQKVLDLIQRFSQHLPQYKSPDYNETAVRRDFIDPFFKELGWDVDNSQGFHENYREVIHEDQVKVGGMTKAPDYSFRIGQVRKFFVEAKKPSVNLKDDTNPALQVRRYAWSASLPISILTDFEEFSVYDCTIKPSEKDRADTGRIFYCTFKEYAERWDEIESIFSKSSIFKGGYDDYIAKLGKGKAGRGTAGIDAAFLADMETWRDLLARNIALRNPTLTVRELNDSVQKTIDRIVFLRICEDRGIEPEGQLRTLIDGKDIYTRLLVLFRHADEKFNSGLFHFSEERDWDENPDLLTPELSIDDKTLKEIINRLYYPQSPYEFSVMPAEILGRVYEQFLGRVIRLTEGHQAKVEEKPEVRKAGGVFYTPSYIVDYIVEHTIGPLLEGKSPKEVEDLAILDPACGSGSFLIGAYQFLLDWHEKWYLYNVVPLLMRGKSATSPEIIALLPKAFSERKKGKGKSKTFEEYPLPIYQAGELDWRLTTSEKKRILINNIYGVDIDPQAVEVTKLSLLLKVLEGERSENITKQTKITTERVLPSLHHNIRCGNSLIGSDIIVQLKLDDEAIYRVNPFDWNEEFPSVMEKGGFDAVIGNPPYIRIQTMKEWAPEEVLHYKSNYFVASKGNYDIYLVFVEQGLKLLKSSGLFGYILPHKFFTAAYGEPLRGLIAGGKYLKEIVHFGHQQVFKGATTYTCLLFLEKKQNPSFKLIQVENIDSWKTNNTASEDVIQSEKISSEDWNFVIGPERNVFEKIQKIEPTLKSLAHIFVGTQTSAEDIFVLEKCKIEGNYLIGWSIVENCEIKIEKDAIKWFIKGRHIRRYEPLITDYALICPYEIKENSFTLLSKEELRSKFPLTFEYLSRHKKFLSEREKGKFLGKDWWAFGYPKSMILFQKDKIICPFYHITSAYAFDTQGYFFKTGYGILLKDPKYSYYYILGLLNSRLLFWFYKKICTPMRGGYSHYMTQYIEQIPIIALDCSNSEDLARHDKLITLVEMMLALNKRLPDTRTEQEQTIIKRQIAVTDKEIDNLVYDLYQLTDEERKIVERG